MILLKSNHPVLENPGGLGAARGANLVRGGVEDQHGAVEQVEHELQARIGGEMNAVGLELGSGKAWQKVHVGKSIPEQLRGEAGQNLWQPLPIPGGGVTVHRGSDHETDRAQPL